MVFFRLLSNQNGLIKSAATAKSSQKQLWFYPITKFANRGYLKKFGALIGEKFYANREELFPTQYFGFHSGVDLEISPKENPNSINVPVYAVAIGKILFAGEVQGYGGVVIQQIDASHTALYGHVKLSSVKYQVDEIAVGGKVICDLGDAFSPETGGERKHLHFGIHRGIDLYFFGHEQTKESLDLNWVDPGVFLKEKGAVEP